jgi:hypothetical protein
MAKPQRETERNVAGEQPAAKAESPTERCRRDSPQSGESSSSPPPLAVCTTSCGKVWRNRRALLRDQSVECIGVWPPFLESERLLSRWPFGAILFNHTCGQSFCVPVDALVRIRKCDGQRQDMLGTKGCRRQCTRAYVFRQCDVFCRRAVGWNFFVNTPLRPPDLAKRRMAFRRTLRRAGLCRQVRLEVRGSSSTRQRSKANVKPKSNSPKRRRNGSSSSGT